MESIIALMDIHDLIVDIHNSSINIHITEHAERWIAIKNLLELLNIQPLLPIIYQGRIYIYII